MYEKTLIFMFPISLDEITPEQTKGKVFKNDNNVLSRPTELEDIIKSNGYFGATPQNIYLTSNDKPCFDEWAINTATNNPNNLHICVDETCLHENNGNVCRKVILTTDQDLINDGVQDIDDEFLEWYVKNPNCDSIEVKKEKIVLGEVSGTTYTDFKYKIIFPKEEHKQETVEQVVKRIALETFNETFSKFPNGGKISNETIIDVLTLFFRLGSEWQQKPEQFFNDDRVKTLEKGIEYLLKAQESMYSEEQVKMLMFDFYYDMSHKMNVPKNLISENATNVDEWFKQHKKKC